METNNNLMQRDVRPRVVGIVLIATVVLALLTEWGAYESGVRAEARATAHRVFPANFCVKCHSDPTTVRMMLYKDDNNGTAAYCAGVPLPPLKERSIVPESRAVHRSSVPLPSQQERVIGQAHSIGSYTHILLPGPGSIK